MTNTVMNTWELLKGLGRLARFRPVDQTQRLSMGGVVANNAQRTPDALMLVTEKNTLTWGQFNALANQYAHYFKALGIGANDSVALLIENEPDMLAALVGLCKLGAVPGLININLRGRLLLHCINAVDSKKVVFSGACVDAVEGIRDSLDKESLLYVDCAEDERPTLSPLWATRIQDDLALFSSDNPAESNEISFTSPAYCIFTSGTTGLPKAAIVTHYHWYRASSSFAKLLLGLKSDDRIYVCLPLFHTAAMLIGFGATTLAGSSFYLARKFSASRFWDDIRQSESTVFLYIGELCRYLLNAPKLASDGDNSLRACVGNGLRPEIWNTFKQRFGIRQIAEYYGSTEGNLAFMNVLNRDRTFGMGLGKFSLVQYDEQSETVVKDREGYCIKVPRGNVGLLVSKISAKSPFSGYADKEATQSKILSNVFEQGDSYMNTGDLIRRADVGFSLGIPHYQFVDRVGDTFRWKGENVSTSEVSEVVNDIPGVLLSSVYGVEIPNTDGRAGMAALVVDQTSFSHSEFSRAIEKALPSYAQPIFVRILASLETTDTHKIKKSRLQKESYDIAAIEDELWVKKPRSKDYVALDADFYRIIQGGAADY